MNKFITKKNILIVVVLFIFTFSLTACKSTTSDTELSKLVNVFADSNGIGQSKSEEGPKFGDGGQKGWTLQSMCDARVGVDFFRYSVEPDAVYPVHGGDDPSIWLVYVEEGSLEMLLYDKDKIEVSKFSVKKGDYMIVTPGQWHSWKNGPNTSIITCVRKTASE